MIHFRELKDMLKLLEPYEAEKIQILCKEIDKVSRGLLGYGDFFQLVNRVLEIV